MLPRRELLEGSPDPEALASLLDLAEQALRSWQPRWSGFLSAPLRADASERLGRLSELSLSSSGGWKEAERCRLRIARAKPDDPDPGPEPEIPVLGLELVGNFLFDPATPADFQAGLLAAGASQEEIGDLWVRGDRGAQLLVTPELAARLEGQRLMVRTVEVSAQTVELERLQFPARRQPRQLSSVEASTRLDAVASAGFGLSRSRMGELIRRGEVRLNWRAVASPSKELAVGDRIQLENRGELLVEAIEPTKRDRWRVVLMRR